MITTFYPPYHFGGDGTYVRGLTHALARRGHEVTVIHDRDAYEMLNSGPTREPDEQPDGVVVHGLRSRFGKLSCLATYQTGHPVVHGARIAEILSEGFDVIHFHNISLIGGPGILPYGSGVKLYTAHEHWLVCPTHILWRHNREPCTERECLRCLATYRRPPQLWRAGSMLERKTRHVDAFITSSHACADRHREFGFETPMQIMAPFLPGDEQPRPATHSETARPYVLFVGRLEAIKGLQDVIAAIDKDRPFDLWIAGSGEYEPELRAMAVDKPGVRFLGYQQSDALRDLYRNALVVVVPSLCYEVLPMVILEAFREGVPVIARNRGPFPEVLNSTGGGILFDTQSELRAALNKVATDDELRGSLATAARNAFRQNWTEAMGLARYFEIIENAQRSRANSRQGEGFAEDSLAPSPVAQRVGFTQEVD